MKAVIAIDSMKGSMTSMEAGRAAAAGLLRADPQAEVRVCPLADGGEGTVDALVEGMHGIRQRITVTGPVGLPVECEYGIVEKTGTAVMEISAAAGITLVPEGKKNPLHTTTRGVGEMIRDAFDRGCRRFLIGIGGSATNDGGAGMLQALGFLLLDENGRQIAPGAAGLANLSSITAPENLRQLLKCEFQIACDVSNPLCGQQGASVIYGPQKGATPDMVREMDSWLERFARLAEEKYPDADRQQAGSGAAGGLGFAFRTFLQAKLEPGVSIVLKETQLERYIRDADVVITGEGRLDGQTAMGKAPVGVAGLAKKYGRPVIAFAGSVAPDAGACNGHGIDAFFPILRGVMTLQEAMDPETAQKNMADTAEQVFRLWKVSRGGWEELQGCKAFRDK